jgi:uncharacterized repeat protein (TIGR03803 family)
MAAGHELRIMTVYWSTCRLLLTALIVLLIPLSASAGWKEKVLYRFKGTPDAAGPSAGVVFDTSGNLYGTTDKGGHYLEGTVFRLSPGSGGQWSESVLHSFGADSDGANPEDSLLLDASGNLYGTTFAGGSLCSLPCGTVFEVSPVANGGWTEKILHNFDGLDGAYPTDNLIRENLAGAFYGTTPNGGPKGAIDGGGTVFRLVKESDGTWREKVLYSFKRDGRDGEGPFSGLTFDASGNLYGTTYIGGVYGKPWGFGTVFQLKRVPKDRWTEAILHSFDGHDGAYPQDGLTMDATGSLYGACGNGGPHSNGTVFKLTPSQNNRWAYSILYDFPVADDGAYPVGTLIWDSKGNLYGATAAGGSTACEGGCGTVFRMSPGAKGKWAYTVLHRFNGQDGDLPQAGLIWDAKGNLYGTTYYGGTHNAGVVYEITP